jgi:enoyl-CoA hydratase/carnithine racemase
VSEFETLIYDETDGVATITLNNPERLNAFTPTQIDELQGLWRSLRFNDDVQCIIITGAGDKAFTTGVDLGHTYPQPTSPLMMDDPMYRIGPKTNDLWKPVIAAVNGMACGGAFYILAEAEFIIAADTATFFDPHVTHGMPAVFEPMLMLQRMPIGEIMRLSLLGRHERMSARRAHEIGLVQEVVPLEQLMETARWSAEVIAGAPDYRAIEATVKAIWLAQYSNIHQALQAAPALIGLIDTTSAMSSKADAIKAKTKITPRIR